MYIKTRAIGTNQYQAKAELKGINICKHCGKINDAYNWSGGAFPMPIKITKCHNCGKEL